MVHAAPWRRRLVLLLVALLAAGLLPPAGPALAAAAKEAASDAWNMAELVREPSYAEVLEQYAAKGYTDAAGVDLRLAAARYSAAGGNGISVQPAPAGRTGDALYWTGEESWVEWSFSVPTSGLYQMDLEYLPLPGKRASIQRDIQVNGVYPFFEAKRLLFSRQWVDEGPPGRDNRGDDIRPRQIEVREWRTVPIEDAGGLYREPFRFYLKQGENKVRMTATREPMVITWLDVHAPLVLPTYAAVEQAYAAKGYKAPEQRFVKVQAEQTYRKSDPTIRAENDPDPLMEPPSGSNFVLNAFGGLRWRVGGQWAAWEIEVPEDGLYELGIKFGNWYEADSPAVRQLAIDDRVPFREMEEVKFRYYRGWTLEPLGYEQGKGKPYRFYLTRGRHTLTLTDRIGGARDAIRTIDDTTRAISKLARQVILITGPNPDTNVDWELQKQIPDLLPRMQALADRLDLEAGKLDAWVGGHPATSAALRQTAEQFRSLIRRPRTISSRLEDLLRSQQSLGTWALSLRNGPLILDYIVAKSPDAKLPAAEATIPRKIWQAITNLFRSFFKDYTGVGNYFDPKAAPTLDVWVARGREWALILKEMADEDFTPATGIRVNVNVLPAGQMQSLVLATVAGKAPDVALGVDPTLPVEFAIRGGALDLSQFPDYKQVASRFKPGALIPFNYGNGAYALPEDQDFQMLFYRLDILNQLGLKPPETWDDVYRMLPLLQQNGLDFFFRSPADPVGGGENGFAPFLYQHGGGFYTPDGRLSALDKPEALAAFKAWTGLYTNYRLPKQADFFNRIRTGEMPIGVANYQTYVLLSTAAPELAGWWGMAPMPGERKPDGSIDRSIGGAGKTALILKQSKQQRAAWEFIKWWTDADAQSRYGSELEALLGVEARWNTANVEALKQLPWPQRDLQAILTQWDNFRETPVVLGGYFTGRHIKNAWNRTVLQGVNPREALEDALKAIDRELAKKQEEFGFAPVHRSYARGVQGP